MTNDMGPILSLAMTLITVIVGYLAKNSGLVTRGLTRQVDTAKVVNPAYTNGFSSVAASALAAQETTSRLIVEKVDVLERRTLDQYEKLMLQLADYNRRNEDNFKRVEEKWALELRHVSSRVHRLETRLPEHGEDS